MNLFPHRPFAFRSGDEVAGFKLLAPAGCGSAGEVYLAEDASGKRFALKISRSERELPGMTCYRTLPPNDLFVTVHAVGKLPDGRIYTLMEAADNREEEEGKPYTPDTLASRIARGPLPAEEALSILLRLLSGVKLLHQHHLIHGDIKPENVIFCAGKAKFSDFGTLGGERDLPAGTADFLPPEFFDGAENPVASPGNDLYAMGKLLYCLWSGRAPAEFPTPPFQAEKREFRLIRPFYTKACHPKQAYRFHSAGEMETAAGKILASLQKTPGRFGRKRGIIAGISALLFFLTAGGIFSLSRPSPLPAPRTQSGEKEPLSSPELPPPSRQASGRSSLPPRTLSPREKELLSSPELYLTPAITARVREIIASAPHTPPREAEGELAFCWYQIEDECRWNRMDRKARKKLADQLLRALEKYDSQ